jgi:flagellar hook protein FlgE
VTPDGAKLQGWPAVNGVVNANGAIGNLSIPFGQISAPRSTTTAAITGNLPAEAVVGTKIYSKVDMFDGQGTAQAVAYEFEKTGANAWTLRVQNIPPVTTPPTAPTVLATQALTFSATTGALTAPAAPSTVSVATVGTFPSMTGPVVLSLAGMVQFGSKASLDTDTQNGYAMGTLNSFALGDDGTLTGNFSNDQRVSLGKLALATFDNPNGLAKAGNSSYRVGSNSGGAKIGEAGSGGRGTLSAGSLEMSNVDLAEEFTGLIVAQRGFQANSRVITSSDEILQDLVRLGR